VNETPLFESAVLKELFRGLFRGVGKYFSSVTWEWFRPLYPGDTVFEDGRTTVDISERPSSFTGGRVVVETYRTTYVGRTGEIFGVNHESYVNAERAGSRDIGRHSDLERQRYTPEDIERIDQDYAAEQRRGAQERWWEDVAVGDALQPVVKGPLTVLDVISYHMAMGWGSYGIGPLRYNWKKRQKMPAFFTLDEYGVPDVVQRMHWESTWAEAIGLPAPYDVGQMRVQWLSHLVTNWMGDDAWLWKLTLDLRDFNFLGDTQWCTGEVTEKHTIGEHRVVELSIRATSQRGVVTTPGKATVILPSKEYGPVQLPRPSAQLQRYGAEVVTEGARIQRERAAR
jgi:acyl dehydratase